MAQSLELNVYAHADQEPVRNFYALLVYEFLQSNPGAIVAEDTCMQPIHCSAEEVRQLPSSPSNIHCRCESSWVGPFCEFFPSDRTVCGSLV